MARTKANTANREGIEKPAVEMPSHSFDPVLASLFASSLGPVKSAPKKLLEVVETEKPSKNAEANSMSYVPIKQNVKRDSTSGIKPKDHRGTSQDTLQDANDAFIANPGEHKPRLRGHKRRRHDDDDDLEGRYMDRLNREEAKDNIKMLDERAVKRQRLGDQNDLTTLKQTESSSDDEQSIKSGKGSLHPQRLQHESLAPSGKEVELEKASRTVFLANVSTMAIKSKAARRAVIDHLESFISNLQKREVAHKVESLRFRSTAFSSNGLPKKAAYAKKELMDSTTKSTNAYAVYSTPLAAKEAVTRLNGTVILDRHLRVDGLAHPAKVDHRRCVFVGNLCFVDDETSIKAAEDEENQKPGRKGKEPADAEEGLWRLFSKAGVVESVRVIRDSATRVGKGFAYVQFQDANGVEKALLHHGKKYPPMLPRILRVTRAKSVRKSEIHNHKAQRKESVVNYQRKLPSEVQSLLGRAGKLFGRAGAAQLRDSEQSSRPFSKMGESTVFEGFRASSFRKEKEGKRKVAGVLGRGNGKPKTRSSKRAAAFKASGGKKKKS